MIRRTTTARYDNYAAAADTKLFAEFVKEWGYEDINEIPETEKNALLYRFKIKENDFEFSELEGLINGMDVQNVAQVQAAKKEYVKAGLPNSQSVARL